MERLPLYPIFVALVMRLFGESLQHVAAVQHVLGLGTVALTYAAGRLTFGRGAGACGGLAAALSGGLLMYEHSAMTEALFTFLLMSGIVLYLFGLRRGYWWCYAGCGLLLGLATLTRSQAQLNLLLVIPGLAVRYGRWRLVLRCTALIWLASSLVLVPWAIRNKIVHDGFSIGGSLGKQLVHRTVTYNEFEFFDPAASGESEPRTRIRATLQNHSDGLARVPPRNASLTKTLNELRSDLRLGEVEFDNILRDVALGAVKQEPSAYVRLVLEDSWRILSGRPRTLEARLSQSETSTLAKDSSAEFLIRPSSPEQRQSIVAAGRLVSLYHSAWFGPLLPVLFFLGLLASVVTPGWRSALVPGLVVLGLAVGSSMITIARFRYHYPLDPLMHVIAFGGILFLSKLTVGAWRQARPSVSTAVERTQASSV
jgi:4-amino-4-deoxy-L-arabinose transferase-like glycosyltransferase